MFREKKSIMLFILLIVTRHLLASDLYFQPYLQTATPDGIIILWETTESVIGKVAYGDHPDSLNKIIVEDQEKKLHQIAISGLKSSSTYYYQCQWGDMFSEIYNFKTAPDNNRTPVRIAIAADSRSNPAIFKKICQQINKYQPDIILHSGDLVAAGDQIEQWKPQFLNQRKI